ncbi:hypothetical protein SCACP_08120 [Sporomusa carbonis]|uniref:hypothetical protein n=1 Tax=Sporomusa carbonis TaxID=3076075 RepID=UPI003A6445DE
MKKLSFLMVTTFVLVMLSGNALAWSDRSEGQPYQTPLGVMMRAPGLFIWHDHNDELHIRSTNLGHQHVFSGIIQTDGRFYNIEQKQLENGDYVKVDRDHKTIRFRFTGRGLDGIDFKVRGGETVDFDLYKDGKEMPRNEIFIGKKGWHPWHNNFYLER